LIPVFKHTSAVLTRPFLNGSIPIIIFFLFFDASEIRFSPLPDPTSMIIFFLDLNKEFVILNFF